MDMGQEMFVAAQKLPLCGLRVFIDVELRVATSMPAPSIATLTLVERLRPHLPPTGSLRCRQRIISQSDTPGVPKLPCKVCTIS